MKFSHKKTKNFNIFRRDKGFSLVEMLIVLLIIGILIAGISQGIDLYSEFKIKNAQKLTINSSVSRIEGLALWLETTLEKSFQTKMVNNSEVPQWNNISPFDLNVKNAFSFLFQQNVSKKPTFLENNIIQPLTILIEPPNAINLLLNFFWQFFTGVLSSKLILC